jgi:phosphotriesterase-related protein
LAELYVGEINSAVDDGAGPLAVRAGVIVVACDAARLTSREKQRFVAAARAHQQTGCPILAQTAGGREAYEQVAVLLGNGATPSQVVLTHCDANNDAKYHRELLAAGVCLAYDRHFRQLSQTMECVALDMITALADEFPRQLLLGMDMTRQKYWRGYGGRPGLAWLLTDFLPMLRRSGISERHLANISSENAVRAFAFRPAQAAT